MKDNHFRSLLKGVSWRITGTIDTIIISLLITGKISIALAIGGVEIITKIIIYYFHERLWERISWGRKIPVNSQYSGKENVYLFSLPELK